MNYNIVDIDDDASSNSNDNSGRFSYVKAFENELKKLYSASLSLRYSGKYIYIIKLDIKNKTFMN